MNISEFFCFICCLNGAEPMMAMSMVVCQADCIKCWWDWSGVVLELFCPLRACSIFHILEHWSMSSFLRGRYRAVLWSSSFIFQSHCSTSFWCSGWGHSCHSICFGNSFSCIASSSSFKVLLCGHTNCQFQTSNHMSCCLNHRRPMITSCWPRLRIRKGWSRNRLPPMMKCILMAWVICGPSDLQNPLVLAGCLSCSVWML